MSGKLLTDEDCETILQNCFKDVNVKLKSWKIGKFFDGIEGFQGDYSKLEITFERDGQQCNKNFFVKTKPTLIQMQTEMVNLLDSYRKEICVYDQILKEFEKRGFDRSFAPKCYLCKDEKTIVLEAMHDSGFVLPKRGESFNLSQVECLLDDLAKYHAGGYMLEEQKSIELDRSYRLNEDYGEMFREVLYEEGIHEIFTSLFVFTKRMCNKVIDMLPESESFKEEFKRKLEKIDVYEEFHKPIKCRKTIGHGDLWSNNMLFRWKSEVAVQCCLLDYQVLRYHHPGHDVLLAIMNNTNKVFRDKYLDYLIHYYYSSLSDNLKKHGFSVERIIPLEEYMNSICQARFSVLMCAMGMHTLSCTPAEEINAMMERGEDIFMEMRGWKRVEFFLMSYGKYENLRNYINEDVYGIASFLGCKKGEKV